MAVFYAVVSGAVGGLVISTDRDETQNAVESRVSAVTQLLDEHANRTLDAAELVVDRVADRAAEIGLLATAGTPASRALISGMLEAAPYLGNIYLVDNSGRLVLDARGFHPSGSSFAERDWVKGLRGDGAQSVVGQVSFDDASRTFTFAVARRITDHSGKWIGIAAALVDVDYFKRFYQKLDIGPSPALGIYRLDGAALVRQPLKMEDIGRNFASSALFTTHLPENPIGIYRGRSPYDAVERVVSYRLLHGRKLVVWVGVDEVEALDGWRARTLRSLTLMLAGFGVMAGLTWVLVGELARERRASAELGSLNRDLARSNADLEQFAYIASHDLKEPLRNIASYVQLLQRRYQGKLDPDADAFIGYTVEGVRRMQAIISELLAYSRIGTGQLHLVPVQAGALVSTALAHLKGVISEAQAAVEVRGPLPVVEADSGQLGSLFQNLIGNALKYRRDDVRTEVVVGCEDRGALWAFYVKDNGIGIDPQYHSQIFDLFKRLHPRDRFPGTGIGLAVCQRVVERHGGRIWVESQAGKGSTFWFSLPKWQGG